MHIGIGLSLTSLQSGVSSGPFASLMSTLLADATQLIAHPLEYGSMFQDRAGTTPVTEPGQLVGMVLDHGFTGSKPVLGPELVTNGTFDDGITGWTDGVNTTISAPDQSLRVEATGGSFPLAYDSFATVIGKAYRLTLDHVPGVNGVSTGIVRVRNDAGNTGSGALINTDVTAGSHEFIFVATASITFVTLLSKDATTGRYTQFDNVSIRELPGYHATAISDAARGVFREVDGIRYIEYNGVNTAYSTPALPAPLVDKAQVFAGVLAIGGNILVEMGQVTVDDGVLTLQSNAAFGSAGTTFRGASFTTTKPSTNVLTGIGDISGDLAALRIDGTQVSQSNLDQGTGNYNPTGTYPLYYGARAGTSIFFSGRSYATLGPITRFSAANATAAQIEAAEAYYTARVI